MTEKKSQENKEKENYSFYIIETSATRLAGFTGISCINLSIVNEWSYYGHMIGIMVMPSHSSMPSERINHQPGGHELLVRKKRKVANLELHYNHCK